MNTEFSYDRLPYPSKFFVQTFPGRLATQATLFGMEPAEAESCRVLELGCGNGSNLIAQAYLMPAARFVGVDLAKGHIDDAKTAAAELGLKNVEFHQMDVTEMSAADFGTFDYITAHGLFSWVPEPVRAKVLGLYRELLNDNGVGYISYAAYPGMHQREMVQRALRFHTAGIEDPRKKVGKAMSFLKFLADNTTDRGAYFAALKTELDRHRSHDEADVFHDDLSEINRAYYFREFAELLSANGLQFLAEAELYAMSPNSLPPAARTFVGDIDDTIEREQYMDLLRGRIFRQTLFCRSEVSLERDARPEIVDRFMISSSLRPQSELPNLSATGIERFVGANNAGIEIDRPLAKAALTYLGRIWGKAVPFGELVERSIEMLGKEPEDIERETEILRMILLQIALASNSVELHVHQPDGYTDLDTKPKVNRLARWQLRSANNVATTLGMDMRIEDAVSKRLLELLDGTRSRNAAFDEIGKFFRSSHESDGKKEILAGLPQWLDESLANLARIGIFESST
ncbi:MAG: class I SAM-dependent methyltransferase [Pyrinomonadaceae bacterium]|nr:class I SAM-dependent methyltransferase [Pyrinomonadaceae bacterium]